MTQFYSLRTLASLLANNQGSQLQANFRWLASYVQLQKTAVASSGTNLRLDDETKRIHKYHMCRVLKSYGAQIVYGRHAARPLKKCS